MGKSHVVSMSMLLAVLGVGPVAQAQEPSAPAARPSAANVIVTMTVGRQGGPTGGSERSYRMLGSDGAAARMLVGWRTPIPTTSKGAGESGQAPVQSYVYQNVGVTAEFDINVVAKGRVRLGGQIEISGARPGKAADAAGTAAPLIGTFQQALTVVVQEGKKVRVAESPDPDGGTLYLDLEVDVQD